MRHKTHSDGQRVSRPYLLAIPLDAFKTKLFQEVIICGYMA